MTMVLVPRGDTVRQLVHRVREVGVKLSNNNINILGHVFGQVRSKRTEIEARVDKSRAACLVAVNGGLQGPYVEHAFLFIWR